MSTNCIGMTWREREREKERERVDAVNRTGKQHRHMGCEVICSTLWGTRFSRLWSCMGKKEENPFFYPNVTQIWFSFFSLALNTAGSHQVKNQFFLLVPMPSVRLHEQYSADAVLLYLSVMWSELILRSSFRPSSSLLVPWRCSPLLQLPEPGDTGRKIWSGYFFSTETEPLLNSGSSSWTQSCGHI